MRWEAVGPSKWEFTAFDVAFLYTQVQGGVGREHFVTGLGPPASHSATMRVKSIWKLNVLIKTKKLGRKQSRRLFSEDRDLN